jgi:TatD DNase family protein
MLIDAHCHLESAEPSVMGPLVDRARAAGLIHAMVIGQFHSPGDFGNALEVATARADFFSPTMGIHPHDAQAATEADFAQLEQLCQRAQVRAVGEAGLDYYYDRSPRDVQRTVFERQCELAKHVAKPLVVHVRDAHADCAEVLKTHGPQAGVVHCFTGDTHDARRYLNLGFHISVSGIVTYKSTDALADAVRFIPVDRLMVETDSPYLAPVPYRGKKNEPSFVVETAKKVAELKGLSAEELALTTSRNAARFFGLEDVSILIEMT